MDLNDYTAAALKTESKIDEVNTNKSQLVSVLNILIGAGNILDDIKKNVFYNRPINNEKFYEQVDMLQSGFNDLTLVDGSGLIDQNQLVVEKVNIDPRIFHGIIGMATESTELLEALLHNIKTGEYDAVNMAEECGDSDWYEAILLDALGQDWSSNMNKNINKLKLRYKNTQFDSSLANDRDLKSERELLEE